MRALEILEQLTAAEISKEAAKADHPTDGQKEAGNYAKGHICLHGLEISIENAKGSKRCGKDKNGKEWSVKMPTHYGYIVRVNKADAE